MPTTALSIPLPFRLFFLYLEPAFALGGAYQAIFTPAKFLTAIIPLSPPTIHLPSPQKDNISPIRLLLAMLASCYAFLAIVEVLVLRTSSELRVWCAMQCALLLSDVGHLAAVQAFGPAKGWAVYWNVREWRVEDWCNFGILYADVVVRVAFLVWAKKS